ncbi:MAG: hypothetical protein ABI828_07290 [Actinomycetota bacterium]
MMLARYFIELPLPLSVVTGRLLADPERWVPGIADQANERGDALLAEVGFGTGRRVSHKVAVSFGPALEMASTTLIPFHWSPVGPHAYLPSLDADIEVAPLGQGRTQVSINARYKPPLGPVGRAVDRALLHRVAEATLKDFLDRLGAAIVADAYDQVPAPGGGPVGPIPSLQ